MISHYSKTLSTNANKVIKPQKLCPLNNLQYIVPYDILTAVTESSLALYVSNAFTTVWWPFSAATCSGVHWFYKQYRNYHYQLSDIHC